MRGSFFLPWIIGPTLAASAAPPPSSSLCKPITQMQQVTKDNHGTWTILAPEQWEFLRGIYVLNPETPPGLPFGTRAALALAPSKDVGLVFFLDGALACTPMKAPKELLDILRDVGTGKVFHEGTGL